MLSNRKICVFVSVDTINNVRKFFQIRNKEKGLFTNREDNHRSYWKLIYEGNNCCKKTKLRPYYIIN